MKINLAEVVRFTQHNLRFLRVCPKIKERMKIQKMIHNLMNRVVVSLENINRTKNSKWK